MECEICGAKEAPYLAVIEGARMQACRECAHMGKILSFPKVSAAEKAQAAPRPSKIEYDVVEGYGMIIRNARMKSHLPLSVLAERLNEKESFLERIEHGSTRPDEHLAKKLEKELGIKLLEEISSDTSEAANSKGRKDVTLGDILDFQRKKKKEE